MEYRFQPNHYMYLRKQNNTFAGQKLLLCLQECTDLLLDQLDYQLKFTEDEFKDYRLAAVLLLYDCLLLLFSSSSAADRFNY